MSRSHGLAERFDRGRLAADLRGLRKQRNAGCRWWAWPALSVPLALLLIVGVLRMLQLRAWLALILLVIVFWPAWTYLNLPHYRAWRTHRRSKRDNRTQDRSAH